MHARHLNPSAGPVAFGFTAVAAVAIFISPLPVHTPAVVVAGFHAVAAPVAAPAAPSADGSTAPTTGPALATARAVRTLETVAVEPLSRPVVVLYGDSLAWEARDAFVFAFTGRPDVQVITQTYGGTAICDWLGKMASDAAELRPGAVVVEFSGNSLTPCMADSSGQPLSGTAYAERYAADAAAVIDIFVHLGTQVIFAGAPMSRAEAADPDFHGGLLNSMYERLAATHEGVGYVDAGAAVLADGQWTETLPCLPLEPCTGGFDTAGRPVNVVRAPDGNHFCPASPGAVRGVTGDCPVWASGAFRYGGAMAAPVLASLDMTVG
jgi:hypothetical protein